MARLTTPNRGQPLDVSYISEIVGQVNILTDLVGDRSATSNINDASVSTNKLKFFAKTVNLAANISALPYTNTITINYPSFNGFPIITATLQLNGTNGVGDDVVLVIKSITTSQVTLGYTIKKTGVLNATVNLIAIGLNNN